MKKRKLFEVITKLELGGAQLSLLELIKSLDKNKYEITLLTSNEGRLLKDALSIKGLKVVLLPSLKGNINLFSDCKTLFLMYRQFKRRKPHIVHTHSSKAGILGRWAAKLAGVKNVIHTIHGWEFHDYQNKVQKYFYIFLEKITMAITTCVIAVSYHDIEKGLFLGIGKKDQYHLIRYGIDKEQFGVQTNGTFRKQHGISEDSFIVGMVACFKPQKAPLDFIFTAERIVQRIPNITFVMVGDGDMRSKISDLIKRLGMINKFILLGWRRDIPFLLSSFDAVALSSLWEGLPIVFLEAMASSKPIVATDINGNAEIVKNNISGFLIKPKDYESFATRIIQLSNDRALAHRMGKEGRFAIDKQFNSSYMVAKINDLYQSTDDEMGIYS